MKIDVWSDIACPWCYLGKHRIEAAIERAGGEHELVFHAFELNPDAPRSHDDGLAHPDRIAKKLRMSRAQIDGLHARLAQMGTADGIDFQFERVRGGNTFDVHRLVQLGRERGMQAAVKERMMKAYFTDGESLGDRDVLARLAAEAGLDAAEARDVLASDRFTAEVRADERAASELGIHGVPCFVFGERVAVQGAQPIDVLVEALESAR